VDFELSDEEAALADSVRGLCASRFPLERLQEIATSASEPPVERAAEPSAPDVLDTVGWEALASSGVFSLQVPETEGGVGLGMAPATVVFEELGRALVPGPLVASHLAARLGVPPLGDAAEGKLLVGSLRPFLPTGPDSLSPLLVPHLPSLGALVITSEDGLRLIDPAALDATRVRRSLDPLTPMWLVDSLPEGDPVGVPGDAACWLRDESILTGALLVGLAAKCVDMAVSYAKEREQFGRPIGAFQAVKHICADMLVRAEVARVSVQCAGLTVDQPDVGDADRAAAGAALLAAEAAVKNAKACIQVHGGMGFTWEVPAHLFLMRARVLAESIAHRSELSELVADRY